jgi:hypothetical protein
MNLDRQLQRRKAAYVQAISDSLHDMTDADREAVLEDVEDHIESALYDGPGNADMPRLEDILEDLGDPALYAADVTARFDPVEPKLCVIAPLGMAWSASALFFAIPMVLMVQVVPTGPDGQPLVPDKSVGEYLIQILGWITLVGLIGGPSLSGLAISKITAARGRLYGLLPALIGLYLIPLLLFDLLLAWIGFLVFNKAVGLSDDVSNIIVLCFLAVLLYLNYRTIRTQRAKLSSEIANRAVSRPV